MKPQPFDVLNHLHFPRRKSDLSSFLFPIQTKENHLKYLNVEIGIIESTKLKLKLRD